MDHAASRDYLKYTLTLAGAGFAYTQGILKPNSSFFGWEELGPWAARDVAQVIAVATLIVFLFAMGFAIMAISGGTGIDNLEAREKKLGRTLELENSARAVRGEDPLPPGDDLAAVRRQLAQHQSTFERNARLHVRFILGALTLVGVLFFEQIFDPEASRADCSIKLNEDGQAVIGAGCAERLSRDKEG